MLNSATITALGLIWNGDFYGKADITAIPLSSASCFTEAVEFVSGYSMLFVLLFLEHVMGVRSPKNSSVLHDFFRALADTDTDYRFSAVNRMQQTPSWI